MDLDFPALLDFHHHNLLQAYPSFHSMQLGGDNASTLLEAPAFHSQSLGQVSQVVQTNEVVGTPAGVKVGANALSKADNAVGTSDGVHVGADIKDQAELASIFDRAWLRDSAVLAWMIRPCSSRRVGHQTVAWCAGGRPGRGTPGQAWYAGGRGTPGHE